MCPRLVLEWTGSNTFVLEFSAQPYMVSTVVNTANPHRCSPGSNPQRSLTNYIFSQRNWRVETMGSRITSLRDGYVTWLLPGTREIEGAGKVELVCVGRLWRMGGECLLMPVWRSVGVGFIGKGELDAWAFKAVT